MANETTVVLRGIAESAANFGLVLFVGAGINGGQHRMWASLVKQLLRDGLRTCIGDKGAIDQILDELERQRWDFYAQATLAKVLLGERYTDVLRDRVYEPVSNLQSHVAEVAAFCCLNAVKAVVTYNYDMFLEHAYNELTQNRSMISIGLSGRDPHGNRRDIIPVYHVHGLLASPNDLHKTADDPVVLAYDEYTASARDACSWAVATQIHLLRSHTCLFLGTSITDWNMLRMLEAAHSQAKGPRHWYLTCDRDFDFGPISSRQQSIQLSIDAKSILLDSVGVRLLHLDKGYEQLYDTLKGIAFEITKACDSECYI